jgi:plasmid stabilization system protein ParE
LRQRLRVVPTAERHIRRASTWWAQNRPAAPALFHDELARAFDLITLQPDIAPIARELDLVGVRRFHLSRIRYHLYYRHRGDLVEVLAL